MKKLIFVLLIFFLFVHPSFAADAKSYFLQLMKTSYQNDDDLGLRIALKNLTRFSISEGEWELGRRYIHKQPTVGLDLIFKWDNYGLKRNFKLMTGGNKVSAILEDADSLMLESQFEKAFVKYQKVAKFLKTQFKKSKVDNLLLYQVVVHSMARALYGAKRYDDSWEVYSWLDQDYPRIRQVAFEKMWVAFRQGKLDTALGAIASQKSSYFSKYMEPESYLILIYIYKQLCRETDLSEIRKEIESYVNAIKKEDQFGYETWAKADIETYGLLKLTQIKVDESKTSATLLKLKKSEQDKIVTILRKTFEKDVKRIEQSLTRVLAYSNIAIGSNSHFKIGSNGSDREELIKGGYEFWPNSDTEDWVDEIGNHSYLGKSLCVQ